jgi:orotidine-5'-phosphate decarboxylase
MGQVHFADGLTARMRERQSQVVVGLDPRLDMMPAELRPAGADPSRAAEAIVAFNRCVLDAVAEHALAVKCQVAFYERYGVAGMRAYAETLAEARRRELIVIGDVKRNDIAGTAAAYAAAHLGAPQAEPEGAPDLVADAVTVNPYLGSDGVRPFIEAGEAHGRGVFVLVKTSNPSSVELQDLDCGGVPLHERVAELVAEWGQSYRGHTGYSLLGAVVGATFPDELARLRDLMPAAPLLVPGFGAQGGGVDDVVSAFDAAGEGAVVNSSRGIIYAWRRSPYREDHGEAGWREAVAAAAADMRRELWQATH